METVNRLARSATAERGADRTGRITDAMLDLYRNLAKGGVGLIITGHAFIRTDGRTNFAMTGAHSDDMIPGLTRLVKIVHQNSPAKIFLQINHAGRCANKELTGFQPLAPSPIPIRFSNQIPRTLSSDEIYELIDLYTQSALRVLEAGFDGVQLHSAHGYLISQFLSPYTNVREDRWGGNPENRRRFLLSIVEAIKNRTPDFPVMVKINCDDIVSGGISEAEFVRTCTELEKSGIAGIEVSGGIPESTNKIIRKNINSPEKEGYFIAGAKALKEKGIKAPVLSVGGYRSKSICQEVLDNGWADIISLSRPLITQPDLPNLWKNGKTEKSRCISCNQCLKLVKEMTHCVHWENKSESGSPEDVVGQ